MESIVTVISECKCVVAKAEDRVYKDECIYCFDTPESQNGLNVCLSTLYGVCEEHLALFVKKGQRKCVFLNIRKLEKIIENDDPPAEKKPTKMAIGMEGGFDVEKEKKEYEISSSLLVTDEFGKILNQCSLPNPQLPLNTQLSIASILVHQGTSIQDEIKQWEEKRIVSKHANNLHQLDNGVKIPPSGWKCSLCDLTTNLWLNLTDGTILCGRKYYDGTGGNNHALEYYQQTKYPLAVKLGTITGEGGDVYSYDEDDMVEDPKLKEHVLHFGINIAHLEKTDKTMTELEIEANLSLKAEWDTIQEAGKKLQPLFGPGYTGMINLGNSCYMNSVMQILFSLEEFQSKYASCSSQILENETGDPSKSFKVQMAKLGSGLLSGRYSYQENHTDVESKGIRPQMFKSLIGRGHPEFSTNHQQDSHEYLIHILDLLDKNEKLEDVKLRDLFTFQYEDRIECSESHQVCYKQREDIIFSLPIPLDRATNLEEFEKFEKRRKEAEESKERIPSEEIVRLKVPMSACIEMFGSNEIVEGFYSTAVKGKTTAIKRARFSTFPKYLVIQLKKFTVDQDWTPKKLDVCVDMMEELDISSLRGTGLQSTETELPEESTPAAAEPILNEAYIGQLMDMGFPLEACKKAVHYTNNQSVEAAMNWIFEHSQDADFASPLQMKTSESADDFNAESVAMIISMGFTEDQAKIALKKNNKNLEAAAEWIFTHLDELNSTTMSVDEDQPVSKQYHDGIGKYKLVAFASHMGTSTSCGHYVAHIKKDNRWVIYNDRKVAVSENPPKDLGYLYFYQMIS